MKRCITNSLHLLLDLNAGMWLGMLIADMALPMLLRFFVRSELANRLIRIIGFLVVVTAVLFYRMYKSYRKARLTHQIEKWKLTEIVISAGIALAVQFVISAIFGYAMYVSGAGYYLGWLLYNVDGAILSRTDVPTVYYVFATLITYPVYIVVAILGSKAGFQRKQAENRK